MDNAEFDNTHWVANMTCIYKGDERRIALVDFDERLVGLCYEEFEDETQWVRCENVILNQDT